MIVRDALACDIDFFDCDVPRAQIRLCYGAARWFRAIEDDEFDELLLLYGSDGKHLCIFPKHDLTRRKYAFARATLRAYAHERGSGLRVQLPADEPVVSRWASWLGVKIEDGWAVL